MFSTAFSAVQQWQFEDNVHMNEHLKVCPFIQRVVRSEPVLLPGMKEAAIQFSSSYADVTRIVSRLYHINKDLPQHVYDDMGASNEYSQF